MSAKIRINDHKDRVDAMSAALRATVERRGPEWAASLVELVVTWGIACVVWAGGT